ncbi:MAG: MlaD family protein [bacterium]|nr:MlaD family protein [bacterium]
MNKGLKAGIFVVAIVVILIVGWIWLAQIEFGAKNYEVSISFPDVTGLKVNDPVKVWGVEKGRVKSIEFKKGYIEVKVLLSKDVKLYSDAYSEILDVAMISGTKYVKLDPGTSDIPFDTKNLIPGEPSLGIPFSLIGNLGDKVNKLFTVAENANLMKSFTIILQNLQETTTYLLQIVKENESDLKSITKGLKDDFDKLRKAGDNLSSAASHVDSLVYDMRYGKGTISKLVNEDSLYLELKTTLSAIKGLAEDIKENPSRYLKIF